MAKVTKYTGTELKKDFMAITNPEEYMVWRRKYSGYKGMFFDDEMMQKFDEVLHMVPSTPFSDPMCHMELWKKDRK